MPAMPKVSPGLTLWVVNTTETVKSGISPGNARGLRRNVFRKPTTRRPSGSVTRVRPLMSSSELSLELLGLGLIIQRLTQIVPHQWPELLDRVVIGELGPDLAVEVLRCRWRALADDGEAVLHHQNAYGENGQRVFFFGRERRAYYAHHGLKSG